jgi:hypothetical protein
MHDAALILIGYVVGKTTGVAHSAPSVPYTSSALRRCGEEETRLGNQLPMAPCLVLSARRPSVFFGVRAMLLTTIVVTGIVFTMIGAVIGYILGFIEAENHHKIKHREKP